MKMIMAASENDAVGRNNALPWKLPADLAHFKKTTVGGTIIMGWNTWNSLPGLLPDRKHVILTSHTDYIRTPNVFIKKDVNEIIRKYKDDENAFIIGGPMMCATFEEYCTDLYLTRVHGTIEDADAFWKPRTEWVEASKEERKKDEKNVYDMTFYHYTR